MTPETEPARSGSFVTTCHTEHEVGMSACYDLRPKCWNASRAHLMCLIGVPEAAVSRYLSLTDW